MVLEVPGGQRFVTFDRGGFANRRPQRDSYPRLQHAEGDLEVFALAAEEDRILICRYGLRHLIGFAQRRKTIRYSASAWTQTSRSSVAIAVRGYARDGRGL